MSMLNFLLKIPVDDLTVQQTDQRGLLFNNVLLWLKIIMEHCDACTCVSIIGFTVNDLVFSV